MYEGKCLVVAHSVSLGLAAAAGGARLRAGGRRAQGMGRPTGAAVAIAREEKTGMTRTARNHAVAPRRELLVVVAHVDDMSASEARRSWITSRRTWRRSTS